MKLITKMVEKPWGCDDIAAAFAAPMGQRIGEIWYDSGKEPLPLLVKWLFTSDKLSVQVHPNDAQAQARGLVSGKEECWYIVGAQPGAQLGIGLKRAIDAETLRSASLSGEIEQMIDWKPVQPGDYYYIPAGTVHAIGAGMTLVEIQQNADITYRLYDYGRLDNGALRPLHLDDAVAVSKPQPYADPRSGRVEKAGMLVDGPLFRLWLADSAASLPQLNTDEKYWIIPVAGTVQIAAETAHVGDCIYVSGGSNIILSTDARILVAAGPAA